MRRRFAQWEEKRKIDRERRKDDVLLFVDIDNCIEVIKEHIIIFFVLYLRRIAGFG